MKLLPILTMFVSLLATSTYIVAEEAGEEISYKKGILSLAYPKAGWKLEELPPPPGKKNTNLRLTADGTPTLSIIITWEDSLPALSAEDKETPPAGAAAAFGLPIALSMAENKSENIIPSVGLINLADMSELSAHFTIIKPGSQKTMNLDAFTYFPESAPGNLVMGAIISEGHLLPSELSKEYYYRLYDAFGIVQSITLKAGK